MNARFIRDKLTAPVVSAGVFVAFCICGTGCNGSFGGDRIREMELRLDGGVATFVIPEHDWLAPFSKPTITEFAVASGDDDELVWQLRAETETGVPARGLAVTFGTMAPGFKQIVPEETTRPKPLVPGRNYYVAAGGATNVYRLIFALPVSTTRPARTPTTEPVDESFPRKELWDKMKSTSQPAEGEPTDAPGMQTDPDQQPGMKPEVPTEPAPEEGATPAEEPDAPPKRPSIFGE